MPEILRAERHDSDVPPPSFRGMTRRQPEDGDIRQDPRSDISPIPDPGGSITSQLN